MIGCGTGRWSAPVGSSGRWGGSSSPDGSRPVPRTFLYGTLAVNLIGSLALGFLVTALAERLLADSSFRLLAMVGFLGAFTTFSAFSYETALLWQGGRWLALCANIGLNVGGCLLATALGILAARAITA